MYVYTCFNHIYICKCLFLCISIHLLGPKFWDETWFLNLVICLKHVSDFGMLTQPVATDICTPRYAYNFATRGHRTMAIAPMYDNYEGAFYQCQGALGLPDLVQTVTDWFCFTMFYPKFKGTVTDITGISTLKRPGATVRSSPSWQAPRVLNFSVEFMRCPRTVFFSAGGWTWWGVVGRFWSLDSLDISFAQSYFWIHDLYPYSQRLEATFATPGTLLSPLSELRWR